LEDSLWTEKKTTKLDDCTREDSKLNRRKSQVGKLRRKYKTEPEGEKEC
jgi:hypothetical protein